MVAPPISFDDGKAPGAMRTIGEVSQALGIKQHILRYWEQQFPMLKPLKRSGGRRLYRPEDVALVAAIDRLVNREGYTLKGAKAVLKGAHGGEPGGASTAGAPLSADEGRQAGQGGQEADILASLRAIRQRLHSALQAA